MRIFCGILASGTGERFSKKKLPKQLEVLEGSAVFSFTLKQVQKSGLFDAVVVSVIEKFDGIFKKSINKDLGTNLSSEIVTTYGGKTRMDSILQIIKKFRELYEINGDDILCLSDASRPLVDIKIYASVIKEAINHTVSCPSKNLVDGVGFVENGFLQSIPDKTKLHSIQTPEACNFQQLIELIDQDKHKDKLGLCEIFLGAGINPKVVESNHTTYKITYPADIEVLQALINYDQKL